MTGHESTDIPGRIITRRAVTRSERRTACHLGAIPTSAVIGGTMLTEELKNYILDFNHREPVLRQTAKERVYRSRSLYQAFVTTYGQAPSEYLQPGRGYLAYLRMARRSPLIIRLDVAKAYESVTPPVLKQLLGKDFLNVIPDQKECAKFIANWCTSAAGGLVRGHAHSGWLFSQTMRYSLDRTLKEEVCGIFRTHSQKLPRLYNIEYHRYADEVTLGLHIRGSRALSTAQMKAYGRLVAEELNAHKHAWLFKWNTYKTRVRCPGREHVWYSEKLGIGPNGPAIPREFLEEVYRKTECILATGHCVIDHWRNDASLAAGGELTLFPYQPLREVRGRLSEHHLLRYDISTLHGYHQLIHQVYDGQRNTNREVRRLKPLMKEFAAIRRKIT